MSSFCPMSMPPTLCSHDRKLPRTSGAIFWSRALVRRTAWSSPDSLRALMTAFHEVAQQGSMAVGSVFFGLIAQWSVVSVSLLVGGLTAMGSLFLFWRFPLANDC